MSDSQKRKQQDCCFECFSARRKNGQKMGKKIDLINNNVDQHVESIKVMKYQDVCLLENQISGQEWSRGFPRVNNIILYHYKLLSKLVKVN